eukprot:COSAG03_NODE_10926_length_621_cov_1.078544_1_plen_89_part_10
MGGHSGEFDEFDEFSVMTLLGASSDQKIMTGEMRKIDHFPMSDVRKTCTICDIRRSERNPSLVEKDGKIDLFSASDGFPWVTDTLVLG